MAKKKKKNIFQRAWGRVKKWIKSIGKTKSESAYSRKLAAKSQGSIGKSYRRVFVDSGSRQRYANNYATTPKAQTAKPRVVHAVGYVAPQKAIKRSQNSGLIKKALRTYQTKQDKRDAGLTARERALKRQTNMGLANARYRGIVYRDTLGTQKLKSYARPTEQEKTNVAKSIQRNYDKTAKSGVYKFISGMTGRDKALKRAVRANIDRGLDTSEVSKSKAYKAGKTTREIASYFAVPEGAIGKGIATAAGKQIAKKALSKAGKKQTKEAIERATRKAVKGITSSKKKNFAVKRAADLVANAPLNAVYAARDTAEEGGDGKDFAKKFAVQEGLDFAIGSGVNAVEGKVAARRAVKKAASDKALKRLRENVRRRNLKTAKRLAEKKQTGAVREKKLNPVKGRAAGNVREYNFGDSVRKSYDNIDKRVRKGEITEKEARREKKLLAEVAERENGRRGIVYRDADGNKIYGRITEKGIEKTDAVRLENRYKNKIKRIAKEPEVKEKLKEAEEIRPEVKEKVKGVEAKETKGKAAKAKANPEKAKEVKAEVKEKVKEPEGRAKENEIRKTEEGLDRIAEAIEKKAPEAGKKTGKKAEEDGLRFEDIKSIFDEGSEKEAIKKAAKASTTLKKIESARQSRRTQQGKMKDTERHTRFKNPDDTIGSDTDAMMAQVNEALKRRRRYSGTIDETLKKIDRKAARPTKEGRVENLKRDTRKTGGDNLAPEAARRETEMARSYHKESEAMDTLEGNPEAAEKVRTNKPAGDTEARKMAEKYMEPADSSAGGKKAAKSPKKTSDPDPTIDATFKQIQAPKDKNWKATVNDTVQGFKRKFINSFDYTENAAREFEKDTGRTGFAEDVAASVNNFRQGRQIAARSWETEQLDYNMRRVGESGRDIMKRINDKGIHDEVDAYLQLLNHADRVEYSRAHPPGREGLDLKEFGEDQVMDRHIITDRFGDPIEPDEARRAAAELAARDPEIAKEADNIIRYFRNDLRSQVQSGLVSEKSFYELQRDFPNYVPAHRTPYEKSILGKGAPAKGSDKAVLPIEYQMQMSTEHTFVHGAVNQLKRQIAEMSGFSPKLTQILGDDSPIEDFATYFDINNKRLTFFDDGQRVTLDNVPENFLLDLRDAQKSYNSDELLGVLAKGNRVFKSLITSYNPAFLVKNLFRDIPEGAFQSKNMGRYWKNLPNSVVSIASNDDWYRAFKRSGVTHSQFTNAEDIFKPDFGKLPVLKQLEYMNQATEELPRLAEFRGYLEALGKTPQTATAQELRRASLAAADVTVNFGRSGSLGKAINSSFVPFFNPALQGFDKVGRVLTQDKTVQGYMKLLGKATGLGIAPVVLNEMFLKDNKEYQTINERDRAVNYYIPLDADNPLNKLFGSDENGVRDGEVFLKIPKARFLSVVGMLAQKKVGVTDIPWSDIVAIGKDQIGPVGIFQNNIAAQAINAINNRTWYGTDIDTATDLEKDPRERYDAQTSWVAKKLGDAINASPKRIDYLIDSYSGVIGDLLISKSANASTRGYLAKNFSTDTVTQNNITTKYFDEIDRLTKVTNSSRASAGEKRNAEYGLKYLNGQQSRAYELRDKIKQIQNSSLSKEEKARKIRPYQRELNRVQKVTYDTRAEAVRAMKKYIKRLSKSSLADSTKEKYGYENAMIATAKSRGDDPWKLVKDFTKQSKYRSHYAPYAKKAGLDPVTYKEFYNLKEYDKDGNGYAKKSEVIPYLAARDDLTNTQKAVLYAGLGGWFAKGSNPFGSVGGSGSGGSGSGGRRRRRRRSGGYRRRSSGRRRSGGGGSTRKKAVGSTSAGKKIKLTGAVGSEYSTTKPTKTAKAAINALLKVYEQLYKSGQTQPQTQPQTRPQNPYKITAKKV